MLRDRVADMDQPRGLQGKPRVREELRVERASEHLRVEQGDEVILRARDPADLPVGVDLLARERVALEPRAQIGERRAGLFEPRALAKEALVGIDHRGDLVEDERVAVLTRSFHCAMPPASENLGYLGSVAHRDR